MGWKEFFVHSKCDSFTVSGVLNLELSDLSLVVSCLLNKIVNAVFHIFFHNCQFCCLGFIIYGTIGFIVVTKVRNLTLLLSNSTVNFPSHIY